MSVLLLLYTLTEKSKQQVARVIVPSAPCTHSSSSAPITRCVLSPPWRACVKRAAHLMLRLFLNGLRDHYLFMAPTHTFVDAAKPKIIAALLFRSSI